MIKYLGSKRRLVPVLGSLLTGAGARTAVDLFTGTTRVAQEFKRRGATVTAVDSATYSDALARCFIATDAREVDAAALRDALEHLNSLPGRPGYFTETFCVRARYLRPENGARVDAVRDEIERTYAGSPLYPILLTSLLLAADRVDSTTGVQMAYLKSWSGRSGRPLDLIAPALLPGAGTSLLGDAVALAPRLPHVDLAYVDPPYNQHRYFTNYHVWETLVRWDAPAHYGVANKRIDARDPSRRSLLDSRRTMPEALRGLLTAVSCDLLVVSYSDEGWVSLEEITDACSGRGVVEVLSFDSRRYVGSQIGIHNPQGERVGTPGRSHNIEHVVVAGARARVSRAVSAAKG